MTALIILILTLFILIAIWNGYVVLWGTTKDKRKMYSKRWHFVGLVIRLVLWSLIPVMLLFRADITHHIQHFDWKLIGNWTLLFVLFGGLFYDLIINAIRYYHEGTPALTYVDYKGWNKMLIDPIWKARNWIEKLLKMKPTSLESVKKFYFWLRIILAIVILIEVIL